VEEQRFEATHDKEKIQSLVYRRSFSEAIILTIASRKRGKDSKLTKQIDSSCNMNWSYLFHTHTYYNYTNERLIGQQ
jgi:hypothetical protein